VRHEAAERAMLRGHETERLTKARARGGDMHTPLPSAERAKQLKSWRELTSKHAEERAALVDWRETELKRFAAAQPPARPENRPRLILMVVNG
jgi:hypothetical protein